MALTVYVVTSGDYSDYSIENLFLDRSKAETFVAARNNQHGYGQFEIAEWETADDSITAAPVIWGAWVLCNINGMFTVSDAEPVLVQPGDFHDKNYGRYYHRIFVTAPTGQREVGHDRAVKVAQDRIAFWQAEQAGIA